MKVNYIQIYEHVIRYYPIGIKDTAPQYSNYKGINLLQELCYNKLQPSEFNKWKALVDSIKSRNSKILKTNTESSLLDPSYSGSLLLVKQKMGIATYSRMICFHLSVIAPYYTIYGLDKILLISQTNNYIDFEPVLYISPLDIYLPWFDAIRKRIEDMYLGYKFLPFSLLEKRVMALSVSGAKLSRNQDASVFQAFFTPEDITNYKYKGDVLYR